MKAVIFLTLVIFSHSCLIQHGQAQDAKQKLTGVWKYEYPDQEGMAIVSPTHVAWILTNKKRQPFTNANPGDGEKSVAAGMYLAAAGEWKIESEGRSSAKLNFNAAPGMSGVKMQWDYVMEGDKMTFWVLDEKGKRGEPGVCRKMAEWNASGEGSKLNGVWKYTDINGIFLHSGSYGIWYIQNKQLQNGNTEAVSASNFDAVNSAAGVVTKQRDNKYVWNVMHATDARSEKTAIFCQISTDELPNITFHFVDQFGKPTGDPIRLRLIEK